MSAPLTGRQLLRYLRSLSDSQIDLPIFIGASDVTCATAKEAYLVEFDAYGFVPRKAIMIEGHSPDESAAEVLKGSRL